MRHRNRFPYETSHEDIRIPLRDGTRLYARIWRPHTDGPIPALVEYAPDRLSDVTAPRDWQRHPWYAGHGYASVRVDLRGHGNSEGLPGGGTALADGVEVIDWLAARPWCGGRVGMFGLGWGATCALRLAALAPEPLKAVVTVGATDDPYDNDTAFPGGSVSADGLQGRSAAILSSLCRPPDPVFAGDGWRDLWLARLEAVEPPLHSWLAHQLRDDRWRYDGHGMYGESPSRVRAAVLAVGGWHEPYRDTVLRLLERLPADRVRGLIGPWAHQYPDHGRPGPAIGFLQETLGWWDHHLKGAENGAMDEPLLRVWIDGVPTATRSGDGHDPDPATPPGPGPDPARRPGPGTDSRRRFEEEPVGRWAAVADWPSSAVGTASYALQGPPLIIGSPPHTGLDAGRSLSATGRPADLPSDQRAEDAYSACFDFAVRGGPIEVLGRARVTLRLRLDLPWGQVVARLCDIAPDGSSTLVTRGVLNLAARHGRERAVAWTPGTTEDVTFELTAIGHAFPPGHRIRLAVSSAYWPWIWPWIRSRPDPEGLVLTPEGSRLDLPVFRPTATEYEPVFQPPEQAEPLGVSSPATLATPGERHPERLVVRDVGAGEWRLETDPCPGDSTGTGHLSNYPDGLELTENARELRTIREPGPRSARADAEWTVRLHRPEAGWDVTVETRSSLTCDGTGFLAEDEVVCRDGREIVFHRTWEKSFPRPAA
ncbi:CocE/NonD family hydrolase [Streptomyces sp. NPDC004838]